MWDSLSHDGWSRVTGAKYMTSAGLQASETYTFDQLGNLTVTGESRTYDGQSQQLTVRGARGYAHDNAGA